MTAEIEEDAGEGGTEDTGEAGAAAEDGDDEFAGDFGESGNGEDA